MIEDKNFLYQFIPKEFEYLNIKPKIEHKDILLKSCYIISLMHELIVKYYFTNELVFNLHSLILRKKYTQNYNHYLDYLIDNKFLFKISKHYAGKKACTFKINDIFLRDIIRVQVFDTVLLKKYKKDNIDESITEYVKSPIPVDIRKKLVRDLYSVELDYDEAYQYLKKLKDNDEIDEAKFNKNFCSIENINSNNIFFKFDSYGRIHTNFTVLKKDIRNNFLKIDGQQTYEVDIKNSQPFFLSLLMHQEMTFEQLKSQEIQRYFDLVKLGLVYEDIVEKNPELKSREDAKKVVYKVFFGPNRDNKKDCKMFRKVYPSVYDFICEYKSMNKNYKCVSHMLQYMESKFIFQDVIYEIMKKHPEIKLITVHDSILFPSQYKNIVKKIFENKLNEIYKY